MMIRLQKVKFVLLTHYIEIMFVDEILDNINSLVQGRRNSIANALELRLSCTNPST